MKVTLNTVQLAAFAAGATLESLGFKTGDTVDDAAAVVVVTPAVVTPAVVADAGSTLEAVTAELATFKASVTSLTGDLATANASLSAATNASILAQATALNLATERDAMKASQDSLVSIARGVTSNMLVALGGSPTAVATMDAAAIVAEHAKVSPLFAARYPAGGVSHVSKQTDNQSEPVIDALQMHMVASGPDALRTAAQKRK